MEHYALQRAQEHTRPSRKLSVKLVEKSLLDPYTDEVFQSIDRSHGEDSGHSGNNTFFDATDMVPEEDDGTHKKEDDIEEDVPCVVEDGQFSRECRCCDVDDDLAIDDEGYREKHSSKWRSGQPWEPSSQSQDKPLPQGMWVWNFLMVWT